MPEWFKEGLISYVGNEWDVKADDQLRTMFANERLKDFGAFVKENPELAVDRCGIFFPHNMAALLLQISYTLPGSTGM
jgi:hypothetical protein